MELSNHNSEVDKLRKEEQAAARMKFIKMMKGNNAQVDDNERNNEKNPDDGPVDDPADDPAADPADDPDVVATQKQYSRNNSRWVQG